MRVQPTIQTLLVLLVLICLLPTITGMGLLFADYYHKGQQQFDHTALMLLTAKTITLFLTISLGGFLLSWYFGKKIKRSLFALMGQFTEYRENHAPQFFLKEAQIIAEELQRQYWVMATINKDLLKDIHNRKSTEEKLIAQNDQLIKSERFLYAVTDNYPGMAAYWDRNLRCLFANKRYIEWFNKTPNEMLGMHIQDVLGKELFEKNKTYLHKALSGEAQSFKRSLQKTNGELTSMLAHYIPDVDARGQIKGIFALVSDVTIMKQSEQAQRIAAVAFESSEAMIVTDADKVILCVNLAFTQVTGYATDEIVGRTPRFLKSDRHDAAFHAAIWHCILQTGSWKGELWNRRKNGEIYPSWSTITAVKNEAGQITHFVGAHTDITERKMAEEEIQHLAFFDVLTGLPNRRLLLDRLRRAVANAQRSCQHSALMFIDLDNFKSINDTLGHDKGDCLLQQVAKRITLCIREGDTVARLGGDEFLVMLENLSTQAEEASLQAENVGEKILAALSQSYELDNIFNRCTCSIGVTLFDQHDTDMVELLKRGDIAMYQAKSAGRNVLRFYDENIQAVVTAHIRLEAEFRQSLQMKEFILFFQAQVDQHGHLTGVEALVRWQHPQRGMLPPADFIPLAEETGLIIPLGHWVLESACIQLAVWGGRPETAHISMSVNVSALQFRNPDYATQVMAVVDKTGANPQLLKLEITESLLLEDVEDAILKMTSLKSHGIRFSLDDFGTGFSSLSFLKRLPLDQLKIDQSFVADILIDHDDAIISSAIVALAKKLELNVIA